MPDQSSLAAPKQDENVKLSEASVTEEVQRQLATDHNQNQANSSPSSMSKQSRGAMEEEKSKFHWHKLNKNINAKIYEMKRQSLQLSKGIEFGVCSQLANPRNNFRKTTTFTTRCRQWVFASWKRMQGKCPQFIMLCTRKETKVNGELTIS